MKIRLSCVSGLIQCLYFVLLVPLVVELKNNEDPCSLGHSIPKYIAVQISSCKGLAKSWFTYLRKVVENTFIVCAPQEHNSLCKSIDYLRFFAAITKQFHRYISINVISVLQSHSEKKLRFAGYVQQDRKIDTHLGTQYQKTNITHFYNYSSSIIKSPFGHVKLAHDNIQQHYDIFQQCIKYSQFLLHFKLDNMLALNLTFCKLYFSKALNNWMLGSVSVLHPKWDLHRQTYQAIYSKFSLYLNTQNTSISMVASECQTYEFEFMFTVMDNDILDGQLGGMISFMMFQDGTHTSWMNIFCEQARVQNFFVKGKKLGKIQFRVSAHLLNLAEHLYFFNGPDFESPVIMPRQNTSILLKTFQGSIQIMYNMINHQLVDALSMCSFYPSTDQLAGCEEGPHFLYFLHPD